MRRAVILSTLILFGVVALSSDPIVVPRRTSAAAYSGRPVASQDPVPAAVGIQLDPVLTTGLTNPIYIGNARDGMDRLFIVELGGVVKVLQPGSSTAGVFLDITSKVLSGGEQGLLGIAFHPQFGSNGRFFVDYTRRPDGATVIAEYHVSAANPNVADTAETVLLTIAQPFANHNGGMIEFGPDDFLYIAMGDGGSGNDPGNRAQNINDLLGKMLRIDVDTPNGPVPYSSPPSNPFFGSTPGRDEIFALGLRNPWRFSFDRGTGNLFLGDVGQGAWEEINLVTNGGNYGWRVFEGFHCTGLDPGLCGASGFTAPIAEYAHSFGRCSVTGGYVYQGSLGALPAGSYVYADFCTGEIFLLDGGVQSLLLDTALNIASFGEDEAGEIYVVALGGQIFRIAASTGSPACGFSISPSGQSFNVNGGSASVAVTTSAGCVWSATSNDSWITITGGATGTGSAAVSHAVALNKTTAPRAGTITIAGQTFVVAQAGPSSGCSLALVPSSRAFAGSGGSGSFNVSTKGSCGWTVVSGAPWITVTSSGSGSSNGTVGYSVAPNLGSGSRQGVIVVQNVFFTVTQAVTSCGFSLGGTSASFITSGGVGSVSVITGAGCAWTAVSNAPWITITSGSSGSGNGAVNYSVAANPNTMSRSGTMTIAGHMFTVNQDPASVSCTFSLSPPSESFGSSGGTGNLSVSGPDACSWTAVSNDSWITVTSGSSGSGDGTVSYSVAANPSTSPRSGTITIAALTFTVNQAPPCGFSISPASEQFGPNGGTGSSSVIAPTGCAWTAVSNDSWITVTSAASGSGSGMVNYSVAASPGASSRTGTITIAGKTFTVSQGGVGSGCILSLSPSSKLFPKSGGSGAIAVNATSGCSWTAVRNVSWITIGSGAKGSGNGAVAYSVAGNSTGRSRTGTITIGGFTFTVEQQ